MFAKILNKLKFFDPSRKELKQITNHINQAATIVLARASNTNVLFARLVDIIKTETRYKSYTTVFEGLKSKYVTLSDLYSKIGEDMKRVAEELNDINERFIVLKRVENEYDSLRNEFNDACNKVDYTVKYSESNKGKASTDHSHALTKRTEIAKKLYSKCEELVKCRRQYRRYEQRKIKGAFTGLTNLLFELYSGERNVFNELHVIYKTIAANSSNPRLLANIMFERLTSNDSMFSDLPIGENLPKSSQDIVVPEVPGSIKDSVYEENKDLNSNLYNYNETGDIDPFEN